MNREQLMETREYKECGFHIVKCPVCGKDTLDNYWVCDHCGWEYDNTTNETMYSDANNTTIKEYRETVCTK